jgi:hypothetical protein
VKAFDVLLSPSNPIAIIILLSHFCLPLELERFLLFSAKRTETQLRACHQTCPFSFWEIWFLASKAPLQVLRLPGNFGLLGIRRSSA